MPHQPRNPQPRAATLARLSPLALALCLVWPAAHAQAADANAAVLEELKALKARIADLERKLATPAPAPAAAAAAPAPAGMTPEQKQDFNRIAVKAEAMEDARDAAGLKGLKFSGYMDPSFVYNQRQHRAGFQFLNAVDSGFYSYDTSYIGTVALDLVKETDGGARWHFTLVPQRSTQAVAEGSNSPVQEASVSVPLGDLQTRFNAGHIPDWSGYEMLQPNQNKLVTHNLLFDFTAPTAYTGAGLELTRDELTTKLLLANMNTSLRQAGEKSPVLAFRMDYAKGEYSGLGMAGVVGKARNWRALALDATGAIAPNPVSGDTYGTADTKVQLLEVDGYFIRGDLTLQGQLSWGRQAKAAITADPDTGELRTAQWSGLSALAAWKFTPKLEGVVRFDRIYNRANGGGLLTYSVMDGGNGIGPGMVSDGSGGWQIGDSERGVDRTALAFGGNYAFNASTLFKVEYRLDQASGAVFQDARTGAFHKRNSLFGSSVVVSF